MRRDDQLVVRNLVHQQRGALGVDEVAADVHVGVQPHEVGNERRRRFAFGGVVGVDRDVLNLVLAAVDFFDREEVAHQPVGFLDRRVGQRRQSAAGHRGENDQALVAGHDLFPLLLNALPHAEGVVVVRPALVEQPRDDDALAVGDALAHRRGT